jgi:hypothetical protein
MGGFYHGAREIRRANAIASRASLPVHELVQALSGTRQRRIAAVPR